MKLFWDFKYLKISLYVVFTFCCIYLLKVILDLIIYSFVEFSAVSGYINIFFKYVFSVFAPLIIAFTLAYLLDPLVDILQQTRKYILKSETSQVSSHNNRIFGTTLIFAIMVLILSGVVFWIALKINSHNDLVDSVSKYVNEFSDTLINFEIYLISLEIHEYFVTHLIKFVNVFSYISQSFANSFLHIIFATGGTILNIIISFVLAFYFLKDKHNILHSINNACTMFLPQHTKIKCNFIVSDIHYVFSGYLRGQLIDSFIMSVLISAFLYMIGVNFSIVIGIVSGFANFIPFFGGLLSLVLSVVSALLSSTPTTALYAFLGVLVLQILDAVFISPKVVGKNVHLSPALIIVSLAISGKLFGVVGMFLTVPVCAFVKLCILRRTNN